MTRLSWTSQPFGDGPAVLSHPDVEATAVMSDAGLADLAQHSLLMDHAYDEYLRLFEAGEAIDVDSFCGRYPGLEKSLKKLLDAFRFLQDNPQYVSASPPPSASPVPDDSEWPSVGDEFLGFALEAELGRGTFARVFRARERAVGDRPVVVKVALRGAAEAATLGRLRHDNIVPVLSVQIDRATGFTVVCMPYQGTATLDRVLRRYRNGTPPRRAAFLLDALRDDRHPAPECPPPHPRLQGGDYVTAVAHLGVQLAEALAKVHALGILHCDLKPSNVLLSPDGRPFLLDFNLAFDPNAAKPHWGGTLPYMAPEQLRAWDRTGDPKRVEPRSDLYALGVILFELLTGSHPFGKVPGGLSAAKVYLREAQQRSPQSLRRLNPQVSRPLARLIESCLAPEPEGRPASAAELAAGLRAALTPWAVRAWRKSRRAVYAASTLLLVAGAAAAIVGRASLPPPAHRLLQEGQRHFKDGRNGDALTSLDSAIQTDPKLRDAYYLRGRVYHQMKNYEAAFTDFSMGDPERQDATACAYRGFYLSLRNRHAEAIAEHQNALRIAQTAEVLNNLALNLLSYPGEGPMKERVEQAARNADSAEHYLGRALLQDENLIAAHYNCAIVDLHKAQRDLKYHPHVGVVAMQRVVDSKSEHVGPTAYSQAARLYLRAAETCGAADRNQLEELAKRSAIEALLHGYERSKITNNQRLKKWVEDFPAADDPNIKSWPEGRIPVALADPLRVW